MTLLAVAVAVVLAACGESVPSVTTVNAVLLTTMPPSSSTTVANITPRSAPIVLALLSGRGDDGSFEVAVHFDHPPGDDRIVVGIDADDSYSGVGDPSADLEGWVELADLIVVGADGVVVAGGSGSSVGDWMSWGLDGATLRIFFIRDLAPIAGTLWVVVGDGTDPGAVAGVAAGEGCSIRDSGRDPAFIGNLPDPGVPCRYP